MDSRFLEEYIHLEKLCNDIYQSKQGISCYIDELKQGGYHERCTIPAWEITEKRLIDLRGTRNRLVHEGISDYDESDIQWLTGFYQDILNGRDPLTQKRIFAVPQNEYSKKVKAENSVSAIKITHCSGREHNANREIWHLFACTVGAMILAGAIVGLIIVIIGIYFWVG